MAEGKTPTTPLATLKCKYGPLFHDQDGRPTAPLEFEVQLSIAASLPIPWSKLSQEG